MRNAPVSGLLVQKLYRPWYCFYQPHYCTVDGCKSRTWDSGIVVGDIDIGIMHGSGSFQILYQWWSLLQVKKPGTTNTFNPAE